MITFTVIATILSILFALYKYSSRHYNYWQSKGIPCIDPIPIFGNALKVFTFQQPIAVLLSTFYEKFNSPYFGMYILDKPFLVIRDPNLIKRILIEDFEYFNDRNVASNEKCDSMSANMLFLSKNPQWKFMRKKMTPTFTAGKLKNMFYLIKEIGTDLKSYLHNHITQDEIEAKEVCGKYATDVITSCSFGLHAHCFESENAPFRLVARQMFDFNWKTALHQTCYFMAPGLVNFFKMPFLDRKVTNFLRTVFWKTLEERERTKEIRHDVIDIIKGFKDNPYLNDNFKFEGDRVLAQAVHFFAAGFETVSVTIAFALYELCLHPQIQDKVRSEIKTTLLEHKELNYTAVQSMKYLDMVVKEILRKYPTVPFIERKCMNNYEVVGEDFVIEKGIPIFVPLLGLHCDPQYFPNPQLFDPERFAEKNNDCFNYLPFGEGPRNCIGERFGLLVTKTGIIEILSEFVLEPSANTPVKITFSPKSFLLSSPVGVPIKFKRNNSLDVTT